MTRNNSPHRKLVQPRAEETRARILQKAREHFAEHGFAAANIRDIAKDAGVTHSMITYHFGTKDELWREAVRNMFDLLSKRALESGEDERELPAVERFRLFARRYIRYCAEHPEHARISVVESIRGGERLNWMVDEFVRANHAYAVPHLQMLMDEGVVPEMPVQSLLYAFVGMTQLPFVLAKEAQTAMNYDFTSEEAIERHADAVIALLFQRDSSQKTANS